MTTPPAPELWLVRHGETEWSASGRHTSRTDLDLTEAGVEDAKELGRRLAGVPAFARVLSSPLLRARRTAELAGFAGAEIADALAEWDYGEDEGRTTAQIREDRPGWSLWRDGPRGGETAPAVAARADEVVAIARGGTGPVLAFSHGHFSRVLAARWLGMEPAAGAHFRLSTASVSVLGWDRETPAMRHWNDTGRLD